MCAVRESVLERVQRTCSEAVQAAGDVTVDEAAAVAAAAALPPLPDLLAACQFMRLPVRFDSLQAEVNAMALFHLLDFGSGFDDLLLAKTGKDARECVQFGLLGMLLSGAPLESRAWMAAFGPDQAFQFFNIDATVDEPVPGLPGVVLTRQGPLGAFTALLQRAMREAGAALESAGHASLGQFVLSVLDAQAASGQPPSAAVLVEELADGVPGFADAGRCGGGQVHFCRKAQLLAAQLHLRFRGADPRFRFADADQLTADSGNVLPAVLRSVGVLRPAEALAQAVDAGADLQGDEREAALRAAAVVGAAAVCRAVPVPEGGTPLQPWQLSMFLLQREERQARARQGGQAPPVKRHVARGTLAY